ncbi:MAG: hypothetical protein GTN62_03815 [Gemmatimonadales bacterium]|nr:hypothetical protein [Gemmatimonadales bacterium]NIN10435.1 hypothetical protein [Gemmatimonadales bacterium]NIN49227.1 hypothetical protein [Gemmatimonadales bacterium]NIP06691.1 hypothetical protein [Gemmatimonadales bacterium]NIR00022.1 hypothetical protein [Gemmatimonadales bacterium]
MSAAGLRRLLHACTAAVLLVIPLASWTAFRVVVLVGAVVAVAFETARLSLPGFGPRVARVVPVFRASEARRPSGAAWLGVGYGIAVWFPQPAPVAGVLVAALADPAASFVGARRSTLGRKTFAGSAAHFTVACGLLAVLGLGWTVVLSAAAVGAALERWSGAVDDNLLVAPGVAAVVALLA